MRGMTVTLYEKKQTSTDPLGAPIYKETAVDVDNVLIGEPTTDEVQASIQMFGKTIRYMLGIPKGDTHNWQDAHVSWVDVYGITHDVRTIGFPITGVDGLIPGPWHMKVRCVEYGG